MQTLNDLVDRSIKLRSKGLNTVVEMEDILAIAEAFRELELLKEQYLNNWAKAEKEISSLEVTCDDLGRRAEAAEAKLAELEKQEPVAWRYRTTNIYGEPNQGWTFSDSDSLIGLYQPLFTRPAPAADLVELVPERKSVPESGSTFDSVTHWCDGFNSCRTAILRNIEEAK